MYILKPSGLFNNEDELWRKIQENCDEWGDFGGKVALLEIKNGWNLMRKEEFGSFYWFEWKKELGRWKCEVGGLY